MTLEPTSQQEPLSRPDYCSMGWETPGTLDCWTHKDSRDCNHHSNLLVNRTVWANPWSQEYSLVGHRGLTPKGKCARANCKRVFHCDSASRLPGINSQVWLCRDR